METDGSHDVEHEVKQEPGSQGSGVVHPEIKQEMKQEIKQEIKQEPGKEVEVAFIQLPRAPEVPGAAHLRLPPASRLNSFSFVELGALFDTVTSYAESVAQALRVRLDGPSARQSAQPRGAHSHEGGNQHEHRTLVLGIKPDRGAYEHVPGQPAARRAPQDLLSAEQLSDGAGAPSAAAARRRRSAAMKRKAEVLDEEPESVVVQDDWQDSEGEEEEEEPSPADYYGSEVNSGMTGIRWDKKGRYWHIQVHIRSKNHNVLIRPRDRSAEEMERTRQLALNCRHALHQVKERARVEPDFDFAPMVAEIKAEHIRQGALPGRPDQEPHRRTPGKSTIPASEPPSEETAWENDEEDAAARRRQMGRRTFRTARAWRAHQASHRVPAFIQSYVAGVRWEKRGAHWHVQAVVKGKNTNAYFRPLNRSPEEVERARLQAIKCRDTFFEIKERARLDPDLEVVPLIAEAKAILRAELENPHYPPGDSQEEPATAAAAALPPASSSEAAREPQQEPPPEKPPQQEPPPEKPPPEKQREAPQVNDAPAVQDVFSIPCETGLRWDKVCNHWHVQVMIRGKQMIKVNQRFKPHDLSTDEILNARGPAVKARDALFQIQQMARVDPDLDVSQMIADVKANKFDSIAQIASLAHGGRGGSPDPPIAPN